MKKNNGNIREKTREYAFLLLKFRMRSEKELIFRLKKKGFPEEVIQETVCVLKEKHFIDDQIFTRAWISSRLKKPWGLIRIRKELREKGISPGIITEQIAQLKEGYAEIEVVRALAEKKMGALKAVEPQRARARVYGYLARRGFSPAIASEVLREL
ncbi:MAG: recombination regulator RecX [Candidatus Omnitrophica bacterium]|nr:recombination regulator RecX [Candidatus Omnitrophota bacterium]